MVDIWSLMGLLLVLNCIAISNVTIVVLKPDTEGLGQSRHPQLALWNFWFPPNFVYPAVQLSSLFCFKLADLVVFLLPFLNLSVKKRIVMGTLALVQLQTFVWQFNNYFVLVLYIKVRSTTWSQYDKRFILKW